MAFNVGNITAFLTLNWSQFSQGLSAASRASSDASKAMQAGWKAIDEQTQKLQTGIRNTGNSFKDLGRIVSGIVIAQAFYGAINAIQATTAEVINFSIEMEVANASLARMLDSADLATGYIEVMKDFAAVTEFSTGETIEFARRLTAMGFEAESTADLMRIITDEVAVLGGGSQKLNRIVYALGQIKNEAKLSAPNVRQLTEATVPVIKYLQKAFNLTAEEAMNIGKQGISGPEAVKAILLGMQEDSKGAAAVIAETVRGMMATIKDDILLISEQLLAPIYRVAGSVIRIIKNTMESTRKLLRESGIGGLINSIFGESMQTAIRAIIGSLKYLAVTFIYLGRIGKVIFGDALSILIKLLGMLLPPITAFTASLAKAIYEILRAVPPLRYLINILGGLLIINIVSTAIMFFYKVLRGGAIVLFFTQAIKKLTLAFAGLQAVIAAGGIVYKSVFYTLLALIAIILSLSAYFGGLDYIVQKVTDSLSKLVGIDTSKIFQPVDNEKIKAMMEKYQQEIDNITNAFGENADGAEKAGKKIKDTFLASFDEVFTIPDKLDSSLDKAKAILDPNAFNLDFGNFDNMEDFFPEIDLKFTFPDVPGWLWNLLLGIPLIRWIWLKFKKPPSDKDQGGGGGGTTLEPADISVIDELRERLNNLDTATEPEPIQVPVPIPDPAPEPTSDVEYTKQGKKLPKRDPLTGRFTKLVDDMIASAKLLYSDIQGILEPITLKIKVGAIEGVTAVIGALKEIPQNIKVNVAALTPIVTGAINAIKSIPTKVTAVVEIIMPKVATVSEMFKVNVMDPMVKAASWAAENVKTNLSSLVSWIVDHWKPLLIAGASAALIALAILFSPVIAAGGAAVGTGGAIMVAVAALGAAIVGAFALIWKKMHPTKKDGQDLEKAIGDNVLKPTESSFEKWRKSMATSFLNGMIDLIDIYNRYTGKINNATVTVKPMPVPTNNPVLTNLYDFASIKKFATGGIVTRETLATIGEGNKKEAVIPLESSGVIRSFARNIASEMGSANNTQTGPVNYIMIGTLIGDDRSITMLERKLNAVRIKEDKRKGVS